jgi:hypothetical protein
MGKSIVIALAVAGAATLAGTVVLVGQTAGPPTGRSRPSADRATQSPSRISGPSNPDNDTDDDSVLLKQPPVVVETHPASGERDVPAGETEIRVRFSKPMTENSWSWSTAWENSAPVFIGQPHYEADGRTCVVKVKLEAGRSYGFWLNSDRFLNFKDAENRPAIPYLLIFQTKPK